MRLKRLVTMVSFMFCVSLNRSRGRGRSVSQNRLHRDASAGRRAPILTQGVPLRVLAGPWRKLAVLGRARDQEIEKKESVVFMTVQRLKTFLSLSVWI